MVGLLAIHPADSRLWKTGMDQNVTAAIGDRLIRVINATGKMRVE